MYKLLAKGRKVKDDFSGHLSRILNQLAEGDCSFEDLVKTYKRHSEGDSSAGVSWYLSRAKEMGYISKVEVK
jgi:hypothetical protein